MLFAVLVFWVVAIGLLVVALSALAFLLQFFDPRILRPFFRFLSETDAAWASLLPLTFASVSLYVFVRAGALLIDHYRATEG